jgi:hypothetical protein
VNPRGKLSALLANCGKSPWLASQKGQAQKGRHFRPVDQLHRGQSVGVGQSVGGTVGFRWVAPSGSPLGSGGWHRRVPLDGGQPAEGLSEIRRVCVSGWHSRLWHWRLSKKTPMLKTPAFWTVFWDCRWRLRSGADGRLGITTPSIADADDTGHATGD